MIGKRFLYSFLIAVFLWACLEEEPIDRKYPTIKTLEVIEISQQGARFTGAIERHAPEEITEAGFVWGEIADLAIEKSFFVKAPDISKNEISVAIESTLITQAKYFCRAYIKIKGKTIYGNQVSFVSLGSDGPKIESFRPLAGNIGDTVIIRGKNFSYKAKINTVSFGPTEVSALKATDSTVHVIVPSTLMATKSTIKISILGNETESTEFFTLLLPQMISLASTQFSLCDKLFIQGSHLDDFGSAPSLIINTKPATILSVSENEISFRYPFVLTGPMNAVLSKGTLASEASFTVSQSRGEISVIEDAFLKAGRTIKVKGANLPTCAPIDALIHNSTGESAEAEVFFSTADSILVEIPGNISCTSGSVYTLKLTIGGTDLASAVLEIPQSKISGIYPDHGKVNDVVVITGENLSIDNRNNSLVNFLDLYSVSDTEYVGTVKEIDAAQNNNIDVIINTCGESIVVEDGFRFDPPEILDFYPKTITRWDEVITIIGTNFSSLPGENHVIFNGIEIAIATTNEFDYQVELEVSASDFIGDIYQSKNESAPIVIRNGTNQEATSLENLVIDYISTLTPSATFPAPGRTESVSFSINGKGYVGLGQGPDYFSDLWEFDPTTEKWFKRANFPGSSRSNFVYAVAGDKAYVGIGGHINDWWEYNPATNVWAQKANYPGPLTYSKIVFTINDKIYVGGGDGGIGVPYLDFWEYDPATDQWTRRKNLPGTVQGYEPITFGFHNKGYVYRYNERYVYDPVLDTWTVSSLPQPLGTSEWEVFVFDNFVVAYSLQPTFEQYFLKILPESNTHEDLNFPGAWNYSPAGFVIGNKGYIGLGQDFENFSYDQNFSSFDSTNF